MWSTPVSEGWPHPSNVGIVAAIKVIIMSATLRGALFINYFKEVLNPGEISPLYFVCAMQYHMDTYFIEELQSPTEKRMASSWHGRELRSNRKCQSVDQSFAPNKEMESQTTIHLQ